MSGGVDSSAAAALLVEQGFEVVGFSMQLWNHRDNATDTGSAADREKFGSCCSLDDLYDARRVAGHLSIPYYVVNFEKEFLATVVQPFVAAYLKGETPSPCVLCNTHLKFDRLMKFAQQVDADYVATGHYARVQYDPESKRYLLLKGTDPNKDQSYFLFELKQEQLARTMLPLGDMTKEKVRDLARRGGLSTAEKAESQEICFVGGARYADFIDQHRNELAHHPKQDRNGDHAGHIVTEDGKVLGTHRGIHHYTVGQRRGLGIAAPEPLYVIGIDAGRDQILVGPEERLHSSRLIARNPNWIAIDTLNKPIRVTAKIRSRAAEAAATLLPLADGRVRVEFDEPLRAITPGQAVVFYQQDRVLGGGWIDRDNP